MVNAVVHQTRSSSETLAEYEAIHKQISDKLALLGAETMLAKVTETKKALKASDYEYEGDSE
jgi:hypothetical protein